MNPAEGHQTPTREEIAAFAARLREWGATLPESERPLVEILVERARELEPEDVKREEIRVELGQAISSAIATINDRFNGAIFAPEYWHEEGPAWVRSSGGGDPFGGLNPFAGDPESFEVTQSVRVRKQK